MTPTSPEFCLTLPNYASTSLTRYQPLTGAGTGSARLTGMSSAAGYRVLARTPEGMGQQDCATTMRVHRIGSGQCEPTPPDDTDRARQRPRNLVLAVGRREPARRTPGGGDAGGATPKACSSPCPGSWLPSSVEAALARAIATHKPCLGPPRSSADVQPRWNRRHSPVSRRVGGRPASNRRAFRLISEASGRILAQ